MTYKKIKNLSYFISQLAVKPIFLFIMFSLIFVSCSVEKQNIRKQKKIVKKDKRDERRAKRIERQRIRKLDNDFLAYYNTFYLAKTKFKNALDVEFQTEDSNLSSYTYYDEAINFSDKIINDFYKIGNNGLAFDTHLFFILIFYFNSFIMFNFIFFTCF